jgi:putative FmdB family regulatory protein
MPFYEYRCADGHVHEEMRRMDDRNEPSTCPAPCSKPAERAVSQCMHHLKSDATQIAGWTKPGWSGVNYNNGDRSGNVPTHLRGLDGHTPAYGDA